VIDRADFTEILRLETLKRPPDWPVYIEGNPELAFGSVAQTIDSVSAFDVKVVLLTRGIKANLGEPVAKTVKPLASAASGKTKLR